MKRIVLAIALLFAPSVASAAEPRAMTLDEVVTTALARHPRLRVTGADEAAAKARVTEAESNRLPDIGVSVEINRSSSNTIPGAFVPIIGFAPIAGPTRGRSLEAGTWQSGASLWASWDVLSFSRQAAAIDLALATEKEAAAVTAAQKLDIAYRAADAYLLLLEAETAVRAAKANVDRAQTLATVTKSLVDQSLRPGADAARVEAELANAGTLVARAEQARDMRRVALGEAMGDPTLAVTPREPEAGGARAAVVHPEIARSEAAIVRAEEARKVVNVEYLPRLDLVAALWMRGSGIFDSPANGLVADVPNWLGGVTLTWSLFDFPSIRARAKVASAATRAAVARRDEVALSIASQLATAEAGLKGAQAIAQQTPKTLASAKAAEEQAAARFKTGLAPVVDLADAQRLLTQAEIDDAVARLEVKRALLSIARASGDIGPFLHGAR
ncbi:MAG: TolC family protein [Labilithrix sp.]|nr:TolC family protein [Labilithrix sp.]MCW5811650.1 TolC family protein [Labilithrix sp.]